MSQVVTIVITIISFFILFSATVLLASMLSYVGKVWAIRILFKNNKKEKGGNQ